MQLRKCAFNVFKAFYIASKILMDIQKIKEMENVRKFSINLFF